MLPSDLVPEFAVEVRLTDRNALVQSTMCECALLAQAEDAQDKRHRSCRHAEDACEGDKILEDHDVRYS